MTDRAGLTLENPRDQRAASRSRVYALFAEAFAYPQGSAVLRLLDGDLLAEIQENIDALDLGIETSVDLLLPSGPHAIREIQRHYSELFDVATGTPAVSLLERRYGEQPEQKLWEQLLAFYSHFGLDFSAGYAEEQTDHLLTELGFMHYLSFLEAGAIRGVDDIRRGQRDFLKLHLARWVGQAAAKLLDSGLHPGYARLFEMLHVFVAADLEKLDSTVEAPRES